MASSGYDPRSSKRTRAALQALAQISSSDPGSRAHVFTPTVVHPGSVGQVIKTVNKTIVEIYTATDSTGGIIEWIAPSNMVGTTLRVLCIGGGGCGDTATAGVCGGGGGAGGASAESLVSVVVDGATTYELIYGEGSHGRGFGGVSSFGGTVVVASGGNDGTGNFGALGNTVGCTGGTLLAGGNGGNAESAGAESGGGGGGGGAFRSAGNNGAVGAGTVGGAGATAVTDGGQGGNGGDGVNVAQPGLSPGGGGGGAPEVGSIVGVPIIGGLGASGMVRLEYTVADTETVWGPITPEMLPPIPMGFIAGEDGDDGAQGVPGVAGVAGAAGATGAASTTPGPPGFPGEDGEDGVAFGLPGPPGAPGSAGATGASSSVPGPPGMWGEDGEDGMPGVPGPTGATGAAGSGGGGSGSMTSLFDHYADVGNVGAGEDDLYSDTVAANTLGANGDKLVAEYAGVIATSGSTLKAYFAGTQIFTNGGVSVTGGSAWVLWVTIIRESSSVIRAFAACQINGLSSEEAIYTRVTGLDFTVTNILKITGQGGFIPADNDIVAKLSHVEKIAAA